MVGNRLGWSLPNQTKPNNRRLRICLGISQIKIDEEKKQQKQTTNRKRADISSVNISSTKRANVSRLSSEFESATTNEKKEKEKARKADLSLSFLERIKAPKKKSVGKADLKNDASRTQTYTG